MLNKKSVKEILALTAYDEEKCISDIEKRYKLIPVAKSLGYKSGKCFCEKCDTVFDVDKELNSNSIVHCPNCGSDLMVSRNRYYHESSWSEYDEIVQNIRLAYYSYLDRVTYNNDIYYVYCKIAAHFVCGKLEYAPKDIIIAPDEPTNDYCIMYAKKDSEFRDELGVFKGYKIDDKISDMLRSYRDIDILCDGLNIQEEKNQYDDSASTFVYRLLKDMIEKSYEYNSPEATACRNLLEKFPTKNLPFYKDDNQTVYDGTSYVVIDIQHSDDSLSKKIIDIKKGVIHSFSRAQNGIWAKCNYPYYNFKNIKDLLAKTSLAKIGVIEFLEKDDSHNLDVYLLAHAYAPTIETFFKMDDATIGIMMLGNYESIDENKKKIWQKIGLSKANYQMLLDHPTAIKEISSLRTLNEFDENVGYESFMLICSTNSMYYIESILRNAKITVEQLINYMDDCYYMQGITHQSMFQIYRDYLNMLTRFPTDMKDKKKLFPDSLKKEHDVLAMREQFGCDGNMKDKFESVMHSYDSLSYDDGKYSIIIPSTANDLFREGAAQSHCVASYVKNVMKQESVILFLRKSEHKDKSFFTIEYDSKKSVVQIKGFGNKLLSSLEDEEEKSVKNFLTKWGKKNHISVNCYDFDN